MPEEKEEPKEEEITEPLKVEEPIKRELISPVERTKTSNLDDDLGNQLTKTQLTDLTDGGNSTVHKHSHTILDDIGSNSHSTIDTHLSASAPHSGHVDTTGNETIAGIKTFSSFPITPSSAPTTDYQTSNKKYVDDNVGDLSPLVAGDVLVVSDDSEKIWQTTTPTKKYEITIGERGGTFRVKWNMRTNLVTNVGYGRLANNGYVIDGTTETTYSTSYTTYSHDVELEAFDLIQLYIWTAGSNPQVNAINFRIYRNEWGYQVNNDL